MIWLFFSLVSISLLWFSISFISSLFCFTWWSLAIRVFFSSFFLTKRINPRVSFTHIPLMIDKYLCNCSKTSKRINWHGTILLTIQYISFRFHHFAMHWWMCVCVSVECVSVCVYAVFPHISCQAITTTIKTQKYSITTDKYFVQSLYIPTPHLCSALVPCQPLIYTPFLWLNNFSSVIQIGWYSI